MIQNMNLEKMQMEISCSLMKFTHLTLQDSGMQMSMKNALQKEKNKRKLIKNI